MKHLSVVLTAVAVLSLAATAQASVIEEATFGAEVRNPSGPEGPATTTVDWDVDLVDSTNTVVLIGTSEPWGSVDATAASVGGTSASLLQDDGVANTSYEIWGVELGAVSAGTQTISVDITYGSSTRNTTLFAVQLSNATLTDVVAVEADGSVNDTHTVTLPGLGAGSYVFAVGSQTKDAIGSISGVTQLAAGTNGADGFVFGGSADMSGDVDVSYTPGSAMDKGAGVAAVGVSAIPEPATLALLGLGGLGMLIRRRR